MLVSLIDKKLAELMAEQTMLTELRTQLEPFEKKVIELCHVSNGHVVGEANNGPAVAVNNDTATGRMSEALNYLLAKKAGQTLTTAQLRDELKVRPSSYESECLYRVLGVAIKLGRISRPSNGLYVFAAQPQASYGSREGKGVPRNHSAYTLVRTGKMPALSSEILAVLQYSPRDLNSSEIAREVLKRGQYKSSSDDFIGMCSSMCSSMKRAGVLGHGARGYFES